MKQQLIWFLIVATIGFIVDASLTHILTKHAGFYPVFARIPAIALAVIATFFLNKILTFKSKGEDILKAFGAYVTAQGLSQALNFTVFSLLVWFSPFMQHNPALAVAIGSVLAMGLTFVLSKFWVFKPQ